jgi:hypothetical protein
MMEGSTAITVFQSAVSEGPCILVQCIAGSIRFFFPIFKEYAGNVFLQHKDSKLSASVYMMVQSYVRKYSFVSKIGSQVALGVW